jgi:hypothetical protein
MTAAFAVTAAMTQHVRVNWESNARALSKARNQRVKSSATIAPSGINSFSDCARTSSSIPATEQFKGAKMEAARGYAETPRSRSITVAAARAIHADAGGGPRRGEIRSRAVSPIERTFEHRVRPRYACSGVAGSWPAATSCLHNSDTGVL